MRRALLALLATGCSTLSTFLGDIDAPPEPDARVIGPGQPDARSAQPGDPDAGPNDCPAAPASASPSTLTAYTRVMQSRQIMGLPCATFVEALDTSAANHCAYYIANAGTSCVVDPHKEVSGCPMFVAVNFDQREVKAGYGGSPSFETMAFGVTGASSVQLWIDSIWHRTPILSPWVRDMGYGDAGNCATMDFGVGDATPSTVIATWPADGQIGVPISFDGTNEEPPPPPPPGGWPSGYPITIWAKGTVTGAVLTKLGDATPIVGQFFGPKDAISMGLLSNDYFLYANAPLDHATTYVVHADGPQGAIDFSFTTK